MRTDNKHAFVEIVNDKALIYRVNPKGTDVLNFRMKESMKIPKENLIYRGVALQIPGKDHEYLSHQNLRKLGTKTYYVDGDKLGYEGPRKQIVSKTAEYTEDGMPIHRFYQIYTNDLKSQEIDELNDKITNYVHGKVHTIPIRMTARGAEKFFIPLESEYKPIGNSGYSGIYTFQITYLAYLVELFRSNNIKLLTDLTLTLPSEESKLDTVLGLFEFGKPEEISLSVLKKSEENVSKTAGLIYGSDLNNLILPEELRKPISQDLIEQAEIDKPLIEKVKKLVK